MLAKELGTTVEDVFQDSLDDIQAKSPSDQTKKKSLVPIIPHVNRKRKLDGESSEDATQKVPKPAVYLTADQSQDNEQSIKIIASNFMDVKRPNWKTRSNYRNNPS